jgi:hypothetical protein
MMLNMVIKKMLKDSTPGTVLSLDMEKAYDRVHHGWLFKVLERLGVGETALSRIKSLYNNAQSTCMVNGFHSLPILQNRGVRQGDALSCPLFILAMIPFILSVIANPEIKGIRVTEDLRISALQYADDTTILLEAEFNMNTINTILRESNEASNMKINVQKSITIQVEEN